MLALRPLTAAFGAQAEAPERGAAAAARATVT